jgi:cytoskeletal protein CcmA (bactofilin family)
MNVYAPDINSTVALYYPPCTATTDTLVTLALDQTFTGNNTFSGTTTIGTLSVTGTSTLTGDVSAGANMTISGNLTVDGTISGTTDSTNTVFTSGLTIEASPAMTIESSSTSDYSMAIYPNALTTTGTAELYLPPVAEGTTDTLATLGLGQTFSGNNTFSGENTFSGTTTISGAFDATSTLSVTDASTLSGDVSVGGTLSVTGTSSLTGDVTTTNTLTVGTDLTVDGTSTFSGAVTCSDGLSTNTLTVNGNPAVTASTGTVSLTVGGAVNGTVNANYQLVNNVVTWMVDEFSATSGSGGGDLVLTGMSSSLLPPDTQTHNLYFPILVLNDTTWSVGIVIVTDASFDIFNGLTNNDFFGDSVTVGFKKFSITYNATAL